MNAVPGKMAKSQKTQTERTVAVGPALRRLAHYLSPHKKVLFAAVLCLLGATAAGLASPALTRSAIDLSVVRDVGPPVWFFALMILAASIVQALMDFGVRYLAEATAERVVLDVRLALYSHLNNLSFSFFDHQRTGEILSRAIADTEALKRLIGFAGVYISGNILILIGIFIVLFWWHPYLALLYLLTVPLMAHAMSRYATRVRPLFQKTQRTLGMLNQALGDLLSGITVIKLFGREQMALKRFQVQNTKYRDLNVEASRVMSFWSPYVFVIMGFGTGLVLWQGGNLVISGAISLGTLTGFIAYMNLLMRPIRQTGMLLGASMMSIAAAQRVFDVLDTKPDIQDTPGARPLAHVRGHVVFENVNFSYDKKEAVIRDVSFEAAPGDVIALVGPTGAGKSTLVHLLARFYEPDSGSIRIDGHDIRDVTLQSLRENVGVVMQETFLFEGSLKDNIAFGKPDASFEQICSAGKAAQLHEFIQSLPDRYESQVGQRGVRLSGGQRQRLSIARTLLRDPSILILDEPTSQVDSETEYALTKALDSLFQGRTVFVIAHRLWTVHRATKILVIEDGRLVQQGSHAELMSVSGAYRDLYSSQLKQRDAEEGGGE